jgi:phosphoglycerate kinase
MLLQNQAVLLLENLRFHSEEEAGGVAFKKQLASLEIFMLMMLWNCSQSACFNYHYSQFFESKNASDYYWLKR